jgi:hypothetical protein
MVFVAVMLLIVELRERENDNDRLEAEKEDLKTRISIIEELLLINKNILYYL